MSAAARGLARPFVVKNNVVLVSKAAARNPSLTRSPDLVLIFGWMDAQLNHLHKFTETYHKLYPQADQILIRSYQSQAWSYMFRRRQLHESLRPAVEALRERRIRTLRDMDPSSKILVHVLSNGGAFQLTTLAKLLNSTSSSHSAHSQAQPHAFSSPSPLKPILPSFIFDSTPGHVSPLIMARALTDPLHRASKPFLAKLLFVPAGLTVYFARLAALFQPRPDGLLSSSSQEKKNRREKWPFAQIRTDLLDASIIPSSSRRLYIYTEPRSGIDRLVPGEDVEEHVRELKQVLHPGVVDIETGESTKAYEDGGKEEGLVETRVDKAVHVGHMREDPEGYWNAVRSFWDQSLRYYDSRQ